MNLKEMSSKIINEYFYFPKVSANDLKMSVRKTLDSFGIDESYQRNHISGCAMDGQYVKLNVAKHLNDIFIQDFHLTWDPAHVIELSIKDCKSKEGQPQNFIEPYFPFFRHLAEFRQFSASSKIPPIPRIAFSADSTDRGFSRIFH